MKQIEENDIDIIEEEKESKVKRFRAKLNEKYFRFKIDKNDKLVVSEETDTRRLLDDVLYDGKNYFETFEQCSERMEYVIKLKGLIQ